jgi:hypothetical protein
MKSLPVWSSNELNLRREQSIDLFRHERLEEPLESYGNAFDAYRAAIESVIEQTVDLSDLREQASQILVDPTYREVLRYFAGPPISADDLETLAGGPLTKAAIESDPELAKVVVDIVMNVLDQRRFPWVRDGREPTEAEKLAAVIASSSLLATRKVGTDRRLGGKEAQELAVVAMLKSIRWKQEPRRSIGTIEDAPPLGTFCRESDLRGNKADVVVRLRDRRMLAIECKVSNSGLNSIKRLNDAKKKAREWLEDFGRTAVIPAVVLGGVFDLKHLEATQERGLGIFWGHDLNPLAKWIKSAK